MIEKQSNSLVKSFKLFSKHIWQLDQTIFKTRVLQYIFKPLVCHLINHFHNFRDNHIFLKSSLSFSQKKNLIWSRQKISLLFLKGKNYEVPVVMRGEIYFKREMEHQLPPQKTHTHTLFISNTNPHTHTHTNTLLHTFAYDTHTHTHSRTFCTNTPTHTHTHIHTHTAVPSSSSLHWFLLRTFCMCDGMVAKHLPSWRTL